MTSVTKLYGSLSRVWRASGSFNLSLPHIRHIVLPILKAAAYTATNFPLPPRHLVFHFPTTSGLPQTLPLMLFTYEYSRHLTSGVGWRWGPRLQFYLSFIRHSHFQRSRTSPVRLIHNHTFPSNTWPSSFFLWHSQHLSSPFPTL